MATYLYRLGRFAFRRRGAVAAVWFLLLTVGGIGAATLAGSTSDTFTMPGTESQRAIDLLGERMPEASAQNATARVVFTTDGDMKVTDPAAKQAVDSVVTELKTLPHVANVVDPYTSRAVAPDGQTALASVTYTVEPREVTPEDRSALLAVGDKAAGTAVNVDIGGSAAQVQPEQSATEVIGIGVAAVVLVITFGSLIAAGLPLLTAVLGVGLGMLGITIATGFFDLSSSTSSLALMLGLAVGIDYALFIVSRYRHELIAGHSGEEAAGRALGTAGSAVVFAGLTVIIALVALSVVGIPFLTAMGLAGAATVLFAVVIALTLLPALLGFTGQRILGRQGRAARDTETDEGPAPMGERWANAVLRHRVTALLGVVIALGVVAIPALDLRLGMPTDADAVPGTTQRQAYDQVAAGFGPGFNGPLMVAVDLQGATDRSAAISTIATDLADVKGVATVAPPTLNPAGDTAILTVIPASGPADAATEDLVRDIRAQAGGWEEQTGSTVFVTGETALGLDVSQTLADALLPYLLIVVGLAFVLLTLVFRSLLVPLKATAGFLLSVVATFGAVVAVFQWGWLGGILGVENTGPIVSFLPIFMIGVLFGLAMDYQVFLVSRMREEHIHGADADHSVVLGFRHGGRVVTAAAIIMASVFAGFMLSDQAIVKSIGFALAFGVLVDSFLIRMTLVPAVMSLLGERAYWLPRWLDRILPNVDVEGEKLRHQLDDKSPVGA